MNSKKITDQNSIVQISTYPPRECGIATFTSDLVNALNKQFNPVTKTRVVALNETASSYYNYPNVVASSVAANELGNYVALAERINRQSNIKLVNVQHEFGIFGGECGDYLIPFVQACKKPVVITLHSILPNPDDYLKKTVQLLSAGSKSFVVMNSRSKKILCGDYGIPGSKTTVIPHGIPNVTFEPTRGAKAELGLENKLIISTFGLLSSGKGIEYAIRALPRVVKRFPNLLYIVLGATHPEVLKQEGEAYREYLQREVERLKLKNNVKFYNKYLTLDEIVKYLKASDVYVSTALNPNQSVSGTLSYALGCGRAVISAPTEYAKYLINETNGVLVKFKNSKSVADAIIDILEDEKYLKNLQQGAYESTRHMTWQNVAASYFRLYGKFADINGDEKKLPEIKLDHLIKLTDDFGVVHHARYSKPEKRFGYSMDDNARALEACVRYYEVSGKPELLALMKKYLRFIKFSQKADGRFANIINFHKKKSGASHDAQGRGIKALGYAASAQLLPKEIRSEADKIFHNSIRRAVLLPFPKSIAFAMAGMYYYLKHYPQKKLMGVFRKLADRQIKFYNENSSGNWHWFEDHLSYSNSILPESLFYAYELTGRKTYLNVAEESLKFLSDITFKSAHYSPIGQNGWYFRNKRREYFDQQPEDAASMVQTKMIAYKIGGGVRHLEDAYKTFQWFLGKNNLKQAVYNEITGGCHDGVGRYAINLNQGAESTISYLLARLSFEDPTIKKAFLSNGGE